MNCSKYWSIAWLLLSLALGDIKSAVGAPIHWRSNVVHIALEGKDLKDVLRDFTSSMGVSASIAPNVQGTVTGSFDMSPQQFLDTLASTFGFVWFYNGNVLSVTSSNDSIHQVLHLKHASTGELSYALRKLGVEDEHFPINTDESAGLVMVNGPPQYVKTVVDVAQRLDENADQRGDTAVRVFKLNNAWAADRVVKLDGSNVTLKGMASVLSSIFHASSGDASAGRGTSKSKGATRLSPLADVSGSTTGGGSSNSVAPAAPMPPLPPGMSFGQASLASGFSGSNSGQQGLGSTDAPNTPSSNSEDNLPNIQADPVTNSVLIRDSSLRMGQYAALIEKLDTKPKIIEIEAHIMEIDADTLKQIGVDFRAHSSNFDLQKSTGVYSPSNNSFSNLNSTALSSTNPTTSIGGISAVLGDAGRYLMASVSALEGTSKAKIDATPRVATLDNVEASMNSKTSFYVQVSGYTSADLYSVSTGVSLKVRPMVVTDENGTRIKLQVQIEDGQLSGEVVNNLPVVTESQIDTEAFVAQGESLLIAGYSTDSNSNAVTGVPGLSKIPFIGALFRYTNKSSSHMERVYLISPRVLDL